VTEEGPKRPPAKPLRRHALAETTVGASPFAATEAPTGKTNQPLTLYQMILARFDPLSDPERTDLLEHVTLFTDATAAERRLLLDVARAIVRR